MRLFTGELILCYDDQRRKTVTVTGSRTGSRKGDDVWVAVPLPGHDSIQNSSIHNFPTIEKVEHSSLFFTSLFSLIISLPSLAARVSQLSLINPFIVAGTRRPKHRRIRSRVTVSAVLSIRDISVRKRSPQFRYNHDVNLPLGFKRSL